MKDIKEQQIWFITGSQHLYGTETLKQVAGNAQEIVKNLNGSAKLPLPIVYKPVVKTPGEIHAIMLEANSDRKCIGIITWMHTFSPAKMWISGLQILVKPFLHLHTQFNRDIPWNEIDMDFMNLNQSAHGDREFGYICSRLGLNRKVVVGYWQDQKVHEQINTWMRAAMALAESRGLRICRFGDNMRDVAVTEGDKVEAQKMLGWQVRYHGIGELVESVKEASEKAVDDLLGEYNERYKMASNQTDHIRYQARIELGLKAFLDAHDYKAFTTNFEDLTGLEQLPGLASQRLMEQGYGFGAEGDWKQSALVRLMKVMAAGLEGGCSFMEDYTYHLDPEQPAVLSAHMLEICPTISDGTPSLEVHPLGIGGKLAPARLVFDVKPGRGLNATLVDMGGRMRMIVNPVLVIRPKALPKLPVARALWIPEPSLEISAAAWILCGGAHHTSFSMALNIYHMEDFAEMTGLEFIIIDEKTDLRDIKKELRFNDTYYHIMKR